MHHALQRRASRGSAEDFFHDESADHTSLPVIATLLDNIIVTSHVRSVVDDNKLFLDVQNSMARTSLTTQYSFLQDKVVWPRPSTFHAISCTCYGRRVNFTVSFDTQQCSRQTPTTLTIQDWNTLLSSVTTAMAVLYRVHQLSCSSSGRR